MEGKNVVLSVLILSLVLAQFQVDASNICCPSSDARNIYNGCRYAGGNPRSYCATISACIIQTSPCEAPNNHGTLENTGDVMKSYCKLGCASSVCKGVIGFGTAVDGAVEQCINACSEFCTKGSISAIEVA